MKTEKTRPGNIVKSSVDGRYYQVCKTAGNDGTVKIVLMSATTDSDGKMVYEETGAIPMDIAEGIYDNLFEVVEKAPAQVANMHEFTVAGGKLYRFQKKIETGSHRCKTILAYLPGAIVMTVKSLSKGKQDLFMFTYEDYDPDCPNEAFEPMARGFDEAKLVYQNDNITGFIFSQFGTLVLPPKGDEAPEELETIMQTVAFYDHSEEFAYYEGTAPIILKDENGEERKERYPVFGEKVFENKEKDMDLFLLSTGITVKKFNGEWVIDQEKYGDFTVSSKITVHYEYGREYRPDVSIDTIKFNGTASKILPCADDDKNFVFVTDEGICYSNYGRFKLYALGEEVLAAVEEYPVPAGFEFGGRRLSTFKFAKADYSGAVKITVEKTDQIGYITKVEPIQ